jgi:hypothetical protein
MSHALETNGIMSTVRKRANPRSLFFAWISYCSTRTFLTTSERGKICIKWRATLT